MDSNNGVNQVLITEDNNIFVGAKMNVGQNYAEKKGIKAYEVTADSKQHAAGSGEDEITMNTAKEGIALIEASTDIEQVKTLAEIGKNWKTVQDAAEIKIAELQGSDEEE